MDNNMFSEMMYQAFQGSMSGSAERTIPAIKPKMKTVRTFKWQFDPESFAKNGKEGSTYPVYGGYNRELSVLLFDVICAVTHSITFNNAVQTIAIMKNYIPNKLKSMNQKPIKYEKPTKRSKPTPKLPGRPKQIVIDFQIECKECKDVKDIRTDFYKGRLVCKSCYSKQVVKARQA